jgi:hypothetical protein
MTHEEIVRFPQRQRCRRKNEGTDYAGRSEQLAPRAAGVAESVCRDSGKRPEFEFCQTSIAKPGAEGQLSGKCYRRQGSHRR